jgi:putative PIN family toxin of toxin-antitoxin system
MRAVLDTNVLLSALISEGKPRELLRSAHRGAFTLVLSVEILNELSEVSSRDYFKEYIDDQQIIRFLLSLVRLSDFVSITSRFNVVKKDPSDDKILRTAYDGKADFIVSGDEHLLALKEFRGIKIVKVNEMLEILKR